jgi:glycosyltransferase involved in cell wall biosynthesis
MSMGRAIVTTDVPGCGESIEDGVQGFVVPAGDAVALAAALERLARDPALAVRMGRAGRLRAETVFDAEMVSRELLGHMALERPAALR